jgi:hypothetical protein
VFGESASPSPLLLCLSLSDQSTSVFHVVWLSVFVLHNSGIQVPFCIIVETTFVLYVFLRLGYILLPAFRCNQRGVLR